MDFDVIDKSEFQIPFMSTSNLQRLRRWDIDQIMGEIGLESREGRQRGRNKLGPGYAHAEFLFL